MITNGLLPFVKHLCNPFCIPVCNLLGFVNVAAFGREPDLSNYGVRFFKNKILEHSKSDCTLR